MVNGKETVLAKSCDDVSLRVNWDGVHFTEAANRWIFQQINGGAFSDPPLPLKFACTRSVMWPECPLNMGINKAFWTIYILYAV